jgi:hypothetical protein
MRASIEPISDEVWVSVPKHSFARCTEALSCRPRTCDRYRLSCRVFTQPRPTCDVHDRSPESPVYVDSGRPLCARTGHSPGGLANRPNRPARRRSGSVPVRKECASSGTSPPCSEGARGLSLFGSPGPRHHLGYLITGGGSVTQEPPFWTITVPLPFVSVSVAAICSVTALGYPVGRLVVPVALRDWPADRTDRR